MCRRVSCSSGLDTFKRSRGAVCRLHYPRRLFGAGARGAAARLGGRAGMPLQEFVDLLIAALRATRGTEPLSRQLELTGNLRVSSGEERDHVILRNYIDYSRV